MMNCSELLITLNAIGRLLAQGDMDRLTDYFDCPLPLYVGNRFILFNSRQKMTEALGIYHLAAMRSGVCRFAPQILKVEDLTARRCLAVIRWHHLRKDGSLHASSTVRYVCRRGAVSGNTSVELMEYIGPGPPHLEDMLHAVVSS